MKRNAWPMSLKKQFSLLLHGLFLCLFFTGIAFIYFNENYGRGLSWLHEESYADTLSCTQQLESDVEMIFKYVKYKDLFETDGKLDYNKDMVCVTFNSGKSCAESPREQSASYNLPWEIIPGNADIGAF